MPLPAATMEEAARHQRDRALLVEVRQRRTYGLHGECGERGPHHLLYFTEISLEWKGRTLNLFTQAA